MTSEPAKVLDIQDKGIINIDMIADLLIFKQRNSKKLLIDNLMYVIQNGQIVVEKEF